jgi:hypothetical protein
MKTIFADYNAITESDQLRLGFPASQEDMRAAGLQPGDWAWLSDGEVVVGARLEVDPDHGLVGVPAWDTLVHVDSTEGRDFAAIWSDVQRLLQSPGRSIDDETKLLQLLTQVEEVAPPNSRAVLGKILALNRVGALLFLGHPELALIEIEEARSRLPDDPEIVFFYLEILRRVDLTRALQEAADRAERAKVAANILAVCINILATHLDGLSDEQFTEAASRLLAWIERFQEAPGRERVDASMLAAVQFNHGLTLLRLGQISEAHRAFEIAHLANPADPGLREALTLDAFDLKARTIASEVRGRPLAA